MGHPLPTAAELVERVRDRGLVSLQELALSVWPGLTWPDAKSEPWIFPAAGYPRSARGQRCWTFEPEWPEATVRQTAVAWLADRLQELVLQGELEYGPRRADLDRIGQVTYRLTARPGRSLQPAAVALALVVLLLVCGSAHAADDIPARATPVVSAPLGQPLAVAALGLLMLLTACLIGRRR